MAIPVERASLSLDKSTIDGKFDREPFGFDHDLAELDLFRFENLVGLAEKFAPFDQDYYVAGSARTPGTEFYAVPSPRYKPHEAIAHLDEGAYRVLLKRPERLDRGFRDLLDHLFAEVARHRASLGRERILRLESAIFISSAAATTPFHFDPEVAFFCQIEGDKIYHVYEPAVLSEPELERFYKRGIVNIGQIDLAGRPEPAEHVFRLRGGKGLHQPQNAPHWVETREARSISYSFVFETERSRVAGRVRSYNHYLRKFGLAPTPPGYHPQLDELKSRTMQVFIPARQMLGRPARALVGALTGRTFSQPVTEEGHGPSDERSPPAAASDRRSEQGVRTELQP